MNYTDTLKSVELILETGEVPLIVGESGIGKTALAKELARLRGWSLIVIDGNLLKEGEIGGLPTIETHTRINNQGMKIDYKTTVYAVHHKLKQIDEELEKNRVVLLLIDEINRCEHTVQQELMNLILNREINGYILDESVKLLAAMNPSGKYGNDFDYQVVDMDAAQENRFVWLTMEPDHMQWLDWALREGLESKVVEFISTFPEYLNYKNKDAVKATPRSYERISKAYRVYRERGDITVSTLASVVKGNVGDYIAKEFMAFVQADHRPLPDFKDVFSGDVISPSLIRDLSSESHTRLYLSAKKVLKGLEQAITELSDEIPFLMERLVDFIKLYPVDLRIAIMKDIKSSYDSIYQLALPMEGFVELYFDAYVSAHGA